MILNLEFTPSEEQQLFEFARQSGLEPTNVLKQLVQDYLPPMPAPLRNERLLATLDQIAARQTGKRYTGGSQTDQILREGVQRAYMAIVPPSSGACVIDVTDVHRMLRNPPRLPKREEQEQDSYMRLRLTHGATLLLP